MNNKQNIYSNYRKSNCKPPIETESLPKIVPGAITFQDRNAMMRVTTATAAGTLAYIIEEQALLVRVNNGWQYIAVRNSTIKLQNNVRAFKSLAWFVGSRDNSTSADNACATTSSSI